MSYLLDTNVVSEFRRRTPDAGASSWVGSVRSSELYLSVLVVGEIRQGIERLAVRDPKQAAAIDSWSRRLVDGYGDRIIPVTLEIAETWGRLNAGSPLPVVDGLLAATALVHDWTLVTRNTADVERTGARVLNPIEN
ncbi:PIN domain-containing protein [Kribbella swartbergensis]